MAKRPVQKPEDAAGNYVDKKEFYNEMKEWKEAIAEAEATGDPPPSMPDVIGEKIILIAEGVARRNNFSGYTYKDEMILDGIENCVRYGHNFDHEEYDNPFAYFSQMVYYAFVRRIKTEKKEAAKKKKCIELAIDDPRYRHDLGDAGTSSAALAEMQKKLSIELTEYDESNKSSGKKVGRPSSSSSEPLFD